MKMLFITVIAIVCSAIPQGLLSQSFSFPESNFLDCNDHTSEIYSLTSAINRRSEHLVSRSDYTHKLDSIEHFHYSNGESEKILLSTYQLGPESEVDILVTYEMNDEKGVFLRSDSIVTTYDQDQNLLFYEIYNRQTDNFDWEENPERKWEYLYSNENLLERINFFDLGNLSIDNVYAYFDLCYDSLNHLEKTDIYLHVQNDSFALVSGESYTHNTMGIMESLVNYKYEENIKILQDSTHMTYHSNGKPECIEEHIWNNGWHRSRKTEYVLDPSGKISDRVQYIVYDEETFKYRKATYFDYSYHDYGSVQFIQEQTRFMGAVVEERLSETEYFHNPDVNLSEVLLPRFGNRMAHDEQYHVLLRDEEWNMDEVRTNIEGSRKFYYSEIEPLNN